MAQPARPKQRVLVRWNDDLDKSLLLFITHTCTEMGIKIPYDEVARRMGSTFSEGAIQQHISKLRNKMAELNVAPVPAAAKRGTVTVKPSSVYGQKSRAGPAPQQPVASKSQARAAVTRSKSNTATGPPAKRANRRRQTTIKRSESDEGPTDDEFDGASDDDFEASPNASGKRGRGVGRQSAYSPLVASHVPPPGGDAAQMYQALADADARYDAFRAAHPHLDLERANPMLVQQWIADFAAKGTIANPPGYVSHYGQLPQSAGFVAEEEEEEDEEASRANAPGRFTAYNPEQSGYSQDEQLSPTSISQMPTQVGLFSGYGGSQIPTNNFLTTLPHNLSSNFQQTLQPSAAFQPSTRFQNSGLNLNSSESTFTNHMLAPQPRVSFQPSYMNSNSDFQMPPPHPPASIPAVSGYGGMQQPSRNDSMVSNSSSQNTTNYPPQTPTMSTTGGVNSTHQSPLNGWVNVEHSNPFTAPDQTMSQWLADNSIGMSYTHDIAPHENGTNAGFFAEALFEYL